MKKTVLTGLGVALASCATLALAAPAQAETIVRDHGRVMVHHGPGGPHVARFHRFAPGHFSRLSLVERDNWRHGHWWHGPHHGRVGWWWTAGGVAYWYPEPVYPY